MTHRNHLWLSRLWSLAIVFAACGGLETPVQDAADGVAEVDTQPADVDGATPELPDVDAVVVPPWDCTPCTEAGQCGEQLCHSYGAPGSFCGVGCDTFVCTEASAGQMTTCTHSSDYGVCSGERRCVEGLLTDCDAHIPVAEACDGVDNDCDGVTDEGWPDPDGDGIPSCLDTDSDADGIDDAEDNCPNQVNPDQVDTDGDQIGDDCDLDLDGDGVANADDCGPADAAINPYEYEKCNGVDDDCDGQVDEVDAFGCLPFYVDKDHDGYGVGLSTQCHCVSGGVPGGYATVGGDCKDGDSSIHPNAAEVCDDKDNDCDGATDGPGSLGCEDWYSDGDGDGYYAVGAPSICLCAPNADGPFTADSPGDCDDADLAINPAAVESCDGDDDNCDGVSDDGCDDDADGYCDSDLTFVDGALALTCPDGPNDCDDQDPNTHPGAVELCDGKDNNCTPDSDLLEGTIDACGPNCEPCPESEDGDQVLCQGVGPNDGCVEGCVAGFFCDLCQCDGTTVLNLGPVVTEGRLLFDGVSDAFRLAYYSNGTFRIRTIGKAGALGDDVAGVPLVQKWTTWGVTMNSITGAFLFAWTTYPDSAIRIGRSGNDGTFVSQGPVVPDITGLLARRHVAAVYNEALNQFLVVWDEDVVTNRDVLGIVLSAEGTVVSGPFTIAGGLGAQTRPQIHVQPGGGGYLVAYMEDGDFGSPPKLVRIDGVGQVQDKVSLQPDAQALAGVRFWYSAALDRGVVQWLGVTGQYQVSVVDQTGMLGPAKTNIGGTLGAVLMAPKTDTMRLVYVYASKVKMRNLVASSGLLLPGSATISAAPDAVKLIGANHHPDGHGLVVWTATSGLKGRLLSP